MEELLKIGTSYLASGVEGVAGLLVALAALQAAWQALLLFCKRGQAQEPLTEKVRLQFGRWLALALEFELGADILRTAITPTWAEIGQLAAIAAIRTGLNYFLQQEIDRAARPGPAIAPQRSPAQVEQPGQRLDLPPERTSDHELS